MKSPMETLARKLGVDQGVCLEAAEKGLGSLGELLVRGETRLREAVREPLQLYVELVSCVKKSPDGLPGLHESPTLQV